MSTPSKPPKPPRDWPSIIASSLLSIVCFVVGAIHFLASQGKADFVLITLIVICFAPWLGRVFESIGKEGLKWRAKQGEAPETSEVSSIAGRVVSSGEIKKNPVSGPTEGEHGATSETVDSTRRPGGDEAEHGVKPKTAQELTSHLEQAFDAMPREAKKVLATLWNFQRMYFPEHVGGRWTFIVNPLSKDGPEFERGAGFLMRHRLAGYSPNRQLGLTDTGFLYCQRNNAKVSSWTEMYTTFDN